MSLLNCLLPVVFAVAGVGFPQVTSSQKPPALIRDTGVAEGKTDVETAKKKEHNPMLAMENLKIGNYYFKKGNYVAAIGRFQDAIEYQPNLIDAYDALGRAYEKKGDKEKAIAVYKDVLERYPESPKAAEFKSRTAKLEKKK